MNEIWVHIGTTNNAARLELKSVSGRSGLGVIQLHFQFEASCRHDASAQRPMWFEGKLSALGLGSSSGYLASRFHLTRRPRVDQIREECL